MKYTVDTVVNLPVEKVVKLFDNPENNFKWMEGLLGMESLSGTPGQPGAKSKLRFQMGKKEMEMTETLLKRNLPQELTFSYEAKGVYNIVKNRFESLPGNKTRVINDQEFRFSGFMKFIAPFMKKAFVKQSEKYLQDFKRFAENSI
ncbi:MAG: SRPBCC family protein [Bacteroidales bacterium]|nr:SRPBCC family protein [Bacteroidales bacterium]